MGICTQDLCEFAVEIFVQNTGFDGQVLGWDACSKNLQLNGTFDLEKLIEHYAGAILENCGGEQTFTLLEKYIAQSVRIDVDGDWDMYELEAESEFSDSNALDVHTPPQQAFLVRMKDIIDDAWMDLKNTWEEVADGEYEIMTADESIPARLAEYKDLTFTIKTADNVGNDGYIDVNTDLSRVEVCIHEVAQKSHVAGHYLLTVEYEDQEFHRNTDGVVGCLACDRDEYIVELFQPLICDALAYQTLQAAA